MTKLRNDSQSAAGQSRQQVEVAWVGARPPPSLEVGGVGEVGEVGEFGEVGGVGEVGEVGKNGKSKRRRCFLWS